MKSTPAAFSTVQYRGQLYCRKLKILSLWNYFQQLHAENAARLYGPETVSTNSQFFQKERVGFEGVYKLGK